MQKCKELLNALSTFLRTVYLTCHYRFHLSIAGNILLIIDLIRITCYLH